MTPALSGDQMGLGSASQQMGAFRLRRRRLLQDHGNTGAILAQGSSINVIENEELWV